jgi:hypothetical protein
MEGEDCIIQTEKMRKKEVFPINFSIDLFFFI